MRGRSVILSVVVVAVIAAATVVVALIGRNVSPAPVAVTAQLRDAYKAPPKTLLVDCEIRFARLDDAELSRVRISPARAARIGLSHYGGERHSHVAFESLGGYIDTTAIIPDWVGTTSYVPKAIPAYIVRIGGDNIESLGPRPLPIRNHFWNVIVSALSGKILGVTTYD
jgi:hypothetical protein